MNIPPLDDLVRLSTILGSMEDLRFLLRESMTHIRTIAARVNELAILRDHYLTKIGKFQYRDYSFGGQEQEIMCSLNECITAVIFEKVMGLKSSHVILDIGHGLGNTVLQAAYTLGCESCDIELVGNHHDCAKDKENQMAKKKDGVGTVRMVHGSLEAPKHFNFLTHNINVALCNTFGHVFGEKSPKRQHKSTLWMAALLGCFRNTKKCHHGPIVSITFQVLKCKAMPFE